MKGDAVATSVFSLVLLAGCIFLYFSISRTIETVHFIQNSELTTGYISGFEVAYNNNTSASTSDTKYTQVLFVDNRGANVYIRSSSSSSFTTDRIGDEVEVRYITGRSREARIASFFLDMWGLTLLFGLFGIVFTAPGIIFVWNVLYDAIINLTTK
ncbi:DUF3592 domain-containing protein [Cellulophaga sp. E16_2]|uniref:DUF3592 domain-containing protein n=1 Tax=unclassified Cellulophaga TaxID=2634405 RepID=UPI0013FD9163|nr:MULTISPECIES: DUF3592 domain-containing protein [unclassified Cellulophaga]MBO0591726.1 DUF3592 domain-containing protein [Cellulophaga sp. E16_2]